MPGRVPDRWFDYQAVGSVIRGTRFIAFKVPLEERICNRVPKDEKFTPHSLIQWMEKKEMKLGKIIDLTNTNRYYNPSVFGDNGIQHVKIKTEGHVVPSTAVQKRYMIDVMNVPADEAIEAFNEARGYPIERINYLNDLKGLESEDLQEQAGGTLQPGSVDGRGRLTEDDAHQQGTEDSEDMRIPSQQYSNTQTNGYKTYDHYSRGRRGYRGYNGDEQYHRTSHYNYNRPRHDRMYNRDDQDCGGRDDLQSDRGQRQQHRYNRSTKNGNFQQQRWDESSYKGQRSFDSYGQFRHGKSWNNWRSWGNSRSDDSYGRYGHQHDH